MYAEGFVCVSERRSITVSRLCLGCGELTIRRREGTMSDMGARTAEEAGYELLGQPTRTPALVSGRAPAAQQPFQHRAWPAHLRTVHFLKQRQVQGVCLFAVAFEAEHERRGFMQMAALVRADRIGGTWMARRITGASGSGELPSTAPRVNLGGSWGRHGFCGG